MKQEKPQKRSHERYQNISKEENEKKEACLVLKNFYRMNFTL